MAEEEGGRTDNGQLVLPGMPEWKVRALVFGGAVLALAAVLAINGHFERSRQEAAQAALALRLAEEAKPPPPPPLPQPTPLERLAARVLAAPTLTAAIDAARPAMDDVTDDVSAGAGVLAYWAAEHMKLADVLVRKDETSFALVRKDSDEARGKRLCATGRVVEIAMSKGPHGKIGTGALASNVGNVFRFIAVGSTGALVEGSAARICGVVIGQVTYANSAGGTTHAVQLVGMFDLPENGGRRASTEGEDD